MDMEQAKKLKEAMNKLEEVKETVSNICDDLHEEYDDMDVDGQEGNEGVLLEQNFMALEGLDSTLDSAIGELGGIINK